MRSNHPRHVEIRLAVPADAAARREALEALLAGRGDLPFLRWRESPVAGHEVVGQNGDEPLPGGVDDPAADHAPAALQPKPMHMVRACLPQALAR